MKFFPERFPPGFCLPDNSPWIIPHPHRTINPRTTTLNQVPFWTTVTKCFELSRFYSKLYLSEESIATGESSTERIVNPFTIRAALIFYIFFIDAVLLSHKIKMNYF